MRSKPLILIGSLVLLLVVTYNACSSSGSGSGGGGLGEKTGLSAISGTRPITSQGTSLGNPMVFNEKVEIRVAPLPASLDQQLKSLIKVNVCLKEIRFKTQAADPADVLTHVETPEITLLADGTPLASVLIPEGNYSRMEIELDNHCASGVSLSVSTPLGTLTIKEPVTLPFHINLTVASGVHNLVELKFEQFLDAMADAAEGLKTLLAAVFGNH